jgi:hypothetical protein
MTPQTGGWKREAVLRPGHDVEVVNVSAGGALLRSTTRLKPGMPSELHLLGATRHSVRGRIARARVISVAPLRYEAALVFDTPLTGLMGSG